MTERLHLHQIDSVNVLARAHYLPHFSRLGPYSRELLNRSAWGRPRLLFEYWAHEASLLPLELHPLLRWRMERAQRGEGVWKGIKRFADERRETIADVLRRIEVEGPLAASDLHEGGPRKSGWWEWTDAKRALEWLFWIGRITTRARRASFERVYDLTERVIPPAVLGLPTPSEAEAHRALLLRSAEALGIATAADLRDYFRLKPESSKAPLAQLVDEGALIPVKVKGWSQQAYLHASARHPRRATGQALLAPFDPMIWERSRTERLFGIRYRIEIYRPAEKRVHGYYVFPFLLGDRLAARVDLKSDRRARLLRVQSAHLEPGAPPKTVERLLQELRSMARWLDLDDVAVGERGDLAPALSDAARAQAG